MVGEGGVIFSSTSGSGKAIIVIKKKKKNEVYRQVFLPNSFTAVLATEEIVGFKPEAAATAV